jgi:hypothetical protein
MKFKDYNDKSDIYKFREKHIKKGFELVNITDMCEFKLGESGWCNGFNEPDDKIYHIQVWYRDEQIGVFHYRQSYILDEDKYVIYTDIVDNDFIIFRKVKV